MDNIELVRKLRDKSITWDLTCYAKPHISYYARITAKQLAMIVRPYPTDWKVLERRRKNLWLPSDALVARIGGKVANGTLDNTLATNKRRAVSNNTSRMQTRTEKKQPVPCKSQPVATEPAFVEYTPQFKPIRKRISRIPTERNNPTLNAESQSVPSRIKT